MRVILLGTGGSPGVPWIGGPDGRGDWGDCDPTEPRNRRTRASIIVEADDGARLLVDTGPDMRAQLLANAIGRVDAILYTHAHADHIIGIDDVRILNRNLGRPIEAFGQQPTLDEISARFAYAFRPPTDTGFYRPALLARPLSPGEVATIAGMPMQIFAQDHGWVTSLGFRTGGFAYSTDVVRLEEPALQTLQDVDTWVVGCVLRDGPHPTHAHLDLVYQWVDRIRPRRTVLTHMSTTMDWAWLKANLPPGIEPGYDGMVISPQVSADETSANEHPRAATPSR
jgi:phosphoribosyl 1,2-cyclic phosphate phosphodiesterase